MGEGPKELDVLLLQLEQPRQMRLERAEIGLLARLAPRLVSCRGRACVFGDVVGRHARRLVVIARRDRDLPVRGRVRSGAIQLALRALDEAAHFIRREFFMRQAPHSRQHVPVGADAARGHAHTLVPVQESGGVAKVGDFGEEGVQARGGAGSQRHHWNDRLRRSSMAFFEWSFKVRVPVPVK